MNKDNVLAVADAIEKHSIPKLGFNMCVFGAKADSAFADRTDKSGHGCGTVACIAGTARTLRTGRIFLIRVSRFRWSKEADWLGLDENDANELFFAAAANIDLEDIEPAQAVAVLRHLAETGKVDWSVA